MSRQPGPAPGVRVVYSDHLRPVDPGAVAPPGEPVRAVVLETGDEDWAARPEQTLQRYRNADRQYAALFPYLEQARIPVYFLEAATRFPVRDAVVMAAEAAVGVTLVRGAARGVRDGRSAARARERLWGRDDARPGPSRRDCLIAGVKAAVGGWLALPVASTLARGVGHSTARRPASAGRRSPPTPRAN